MNIIKRIVTFRPSFTVRVIFGVISVIGFLAACAFVGISDLSRALGAQDEKYNARAIEAGAQVYFEQCSRCHGTDGKGVEGQGPALSSLNFLGKVDENGVEVQKSQRVIDVGWPSTLDSYVRAVTASGIPLKSSNEWEVTHPAFGQAYGGNLRDDQIVNVSKFILNWRQSPAESGVIDSPKPGEGFTPKPTAVPLTPEQEAGKAVFLKTGCNACHTIKGVSNGGIGPNLSKIATDAPEIIASAEYKSSQGKATTPEEFIHESIVSPNAYVAPQCPTGPCPANVMPPNFEQTIAPADLTNLVAYLNSLK
jgi:mono/diheme cytochrome c family protein